MLDPENASENVSWFGYPMPIKGTEAAFAELASDDPAIQITTDAARQRRAVPRARRPQDKKAWDRVWTEVKA